MSPFILQPFKDSSGIPMWSARRDGSGIHGIGMTPEAAREDFRKKERELLPDEESEVNRYTTPGRIIHSSAFEPPTYADDRREEHDDE